MRMVSKSLSMLFVAVLLQGMLAGGTASAAKPEGNQPPLPMPSSEAQKVYAAARKDLLQLRVLMRNGRIQNSVGSGFLVDQGNLVITNYHVVSQIALEPETYVGEYVDTEGRRGPFDLIAVDVLHDLAVVRVGVSGSGYFDIPGNLPTLVQGQHLYSLGNPLDLGFAISEGAYNGVIRRGFYEQLMFTGPINAGMSGGPAVTVDGRLAGVNVSKRLDGELVSFLVPVQYVKDLLRKADPQKIPRDFKAVVGRQLLTHQNLVVSRFLDNPLAVKTLGGYRVPVNESDQMRCWGRSNNRKDAMYTLDQISCTTEADIFVSDRLQLGQVSIKHDYRSSSKLGPLRFSALAANAFKREGFGGYKDREKTAPQCSERFVNPSKLPLRAVVCVRGYRKFSGLYDFSVLTTSTDDSAMNLQSRLDIRGVSYENGLRFAQAFIESIGKEKKP